MKVLVYLLLWLALVAAADAADVPPGHAEPQAAPTEAREEGDEAKERNEARTRPARATAENADDDRKDDNNKDDDKNAAKPAAARDEDDRKNEDTGGKLSLTSPQQEAVGIRLETPRALSSAPLIEAYGTVLDPVALLTDAGRLDSTRAAAAAANADAARQGSLYRDGAQASLKTLQASQAQSVEASVQAQAAGMAFRQQWGPLANLADEQRRTLLSALGRGEHLLLRAEVPGRHFQGEIGHEALVQVDGVQLNARVLGPLSRAEAQSQSAGWLLEVDRGPPGLGPGARVAVRLKAAALQGMLVPATALVYAQSGAYVYRRITGDKPDTFSYESVAVRPLSRVGDAWLVSGLARTDQIVVQGAGVLWSLQGINSFSAAEEEHD